MGRKAAKYGYKKLGVPGAVIGGVGAVMGYRWLKRRTKRAAMEDLAENPRGPVSSDEPRTPGAGVGADVGGTDIPIDERIGSVNDGDEHPASPNVDDQSNPFESDADETSGDTTEPTDDDQDNPFEKDEKQ